MIFKRRGFSNRIPARVVRNLPVGVQTYPMDAVFCLLGTISGVGTIGRVITSQALTAALPPWALTIWAGLLTIGSIAWGIGILSVHHNGTGEVIITKVPIMILGLGLISVVTLVYGIAVISRGGTAGLIASFAYFAISGGTYVRRWVIMNRLDGG